MNNPLANALECGGKIVTVEDHYPEVLKYILTQQYFDNRTVTSFAIITLIGANYLINVMLI